MNVENLKISIIELDSRDNVFISKLDKLYNDLHGKNIYNENFVIKLFILLYKLIKLNNLNKSQNLCLIWCKSYIVENALQKKILY